MLIFLFCSETAGLSVTQRVENVGICTCQMALQLAGKLSIIKGSIIWCLNTARPKFALLTRQPQAIFSDKPQPPVFFITIHILFKIAISCKWSRNPKPIFVNLLFAMTVLLQLCKGLIDEFSSRRLYKVSKKP